VGKGHFKGTTVTAALAALLCSAPPATARPLILPAISPWNAHWSPTTCSLRRLFGTKEKQSLIVIERFGPSDTFQLSIVSDEFKSFEQGEDLQLKFGDAKARRISGVAPGKTEKGTATLFFPTQSLSQPIGNGQDRWDTPVTHATEAATKTISVSYFGHERVFTTGPLDKPFDALRKCTDDLVASWGLDPKQQATLTKHPEPKSEPTTWLRFADYPASMLFNGKQALVNFRLSVDAQGTPTACEVQRSYNDQTFDQVTCAILMRRARFSPALDVQGRAVPSYYLNTVHWIVG
jgi:hypothetical protein